MAVHSLPDDLRAALGLTRDANVEHAALSSYPSARGSMRSALVVTDRVVFLAEAAPDEPWQWRTHARDAVTGKRQHPLKSRRPPKASRTDRRTWPSLGQRAQALKRFRTLWASAAQDATKAGEARIPAAFAEIAGWGPP